MTSSRRIGHVGEGYGGFGDALPLILCRAAPRSGCRAQGGGDARLVVNLHENTRQPCFIRLRPVQHLHGFHTTCRIDLKSQ